MSKDEDDIVINVSVPLTKKELADVDEFLEHHPELAKNRSEAVKHMTGLKTYRALKEEADPDRLRPSMNVELNWEWSQPSIIPCALKDFLPHRDEFINMTPLTTSSIVKIINHPDFGIGTYPRLYREALVETLREWKITEGMIALEKC